MKKKQSAVRYRGAFGESPTASLWRTMNVRGTGTNRSFSVMMTAAKHPIHRVPFLRVGGASFAR